MALARRLINRPRKASHIDDRRRYRPRATGRSQHDHMVAEREQEGTYLHACKIDQTITAPPCPPPASCQK